ncbi:hypothetical protein [Alteromonas lipolytica]|uniref:Polysaccharide chain length determinant N-terminal domain-containing protein n=1 Tax=Alteromonas lipolytica TaxID=1856405 RepID=A0A1E8FAX7_9ALTE|nr:hypothetical protein [Alteromonas lipolytica]OFI33065.1 hypothetical protein BFC17_01995 [Alteromonas lipolytica]GGF62793.1 hypothetical protein GCM10011338_14080 [Alteromonas lipolytica]
MTKPVAPPHPPAQQPLPTQAMPFGVDDDVDLIEYLNAILRFKYRIVLCAVLVAGVVFGLSLMVENRYMSTAVVALNIKEKPGGVSPKEYRASDALGLLEHDFIIEGAHSNEQDRLLARMRSMKFSQTFIQENQLLPYIFHKQWDSALQQWKGEFKPDLREAGMTFMTTLRGVELDEATGLLRINFTTRDPALSATLANTFVARFNQYIRDAEASELEARREYLTQRLNEVDNIELHKSIYRLMETQLAAESLLYARTEYPLELIQPAFPALYKTYPLRKKWAVMAMLATIMLGIMIAIGSVLFGKIRQAVSAYQVKQVEDLLAPAQKPAAAPTEEHQTDDTRYRGDEWIDDK